MDNTYKRLGVWLGTSIYFLAILFVIRGAGYGPNYSVYVPNNTTAYKMELFTTSFSTVRYFVIPYFLRFTMTYIVYLLFLLKIAPGLTKGKHLLLYALGILCLYIITGGVFGYTDTFLRGYLFYLKGSDFEVVRNQIYLNALLYTFGVFLIYILFTLLKANCSRISSKINNAQGADFIINDCVTAAAVWVLIFSAIYIPDLTDDNAILWGYIAFMIPLYAYFSLITIPSVKSENRKIAFFRWSFFKVILIFTTLIGIYTYLNGSFSGHPGLILEFVGFNFLFHVLVTTPATWYIYHYRFSKWSELKRLNTALSQSSASIDFLQSQINPHFLFNTLNALYGTAIQENSVKTAAGIQKLSEMMRFMLHENHQARIPLKKEIDYIRNYIELQLLRVGSSPKLVVEANVDDDVLGLSIAPMILIPFIENSFKHGISRKDKSWIKIRLMLKHKQLHFTIANSIHERNYQVPKHKSGVGLENVIQRLALAYYQKHQLSIDNLQNEFVVDLSVDLSD